MRKKLSFILLFTTICISMICVSCSSEQDNINQQSNFDKLSFNISVNDKPQYNGSTRADSPKEDWATGDTIYLAIDKSNDNVCYMVYVGNNKWTVKANNNKTSFANPSGTLSAVYATHIKYDSISTRNALTCGDVLYTNDGSYTKSGNIVSISLNMNQRPLSKITIKGVDSSFWIDNCSEYTELKSLYPIQWSTSSTNGAYNKVVEGNNTSVFYGMIQPDSNNNTSITLKNKDGVTYTRTYDGKTTETGHSIIINGPLSGEASQWTCNIPVNGISLNDSTLALCEGDNTTLTATISPANASNKNVAWSTSNSNVATVSSTGEIKAVGLGAATVTVTSTDGNYTASCVVNVKNITDFITLNFISSSTIYLNGYIFGSIYSQITNSSSHVINLTKFTITNSSTNVVVAYKNNIGNLAPNSSTNLGANLNSVYLPIFTWTYTYNGQTYTVSQQYN
jgi:uncharacterized protein YjdB